MPLRGEHLRKKRIWSGFPLAGIFSCFPLLPRFHHHHPAGQPRSLLLALYNCFVDSVLLLKKQGIPH